MKANNVQIEAGNKQVAENDASGKLAFGFTDTADAIIEVEKGKAVKIIYPDTGESAMGTLFIPNTVSLMKNAPHSVEAKMLIDYLLSKEVEIALADSPSAQIPLNTEVNHKTRVKTPKEIKAIEVDFVLAAERFKNAAIFIKENFLN